MSRDRNIACLAPPDMFFFMYFGCTTMDMYIMKPEPYQSLKSIRIHLVPRIQFQNFQHHAYSPTIASASLYTLLVQRSLHVP